VDRVQFAQWLRRIFETQVEEICCSECFDLVSQFVDLEVARQPAELKLPGLRQHLDQCRVCREEYELLLDLARLEVEGRAPSIGDLLRSL